MVKIKGIIPTSFIDYPDRISSVIFFSGCNFKCPYCHNPELIVQEPPFIEEDKIIKQLVKNKKWLDGVVITGGEPLIQKDIINFLKKIRKTGLEIKIDTNGSNPELLNNIIKEGLVDYIAMDVKTSLDNYKKVAKNNINDKIKNSIKIIMNSGINYEFRITVVPNIINKEDIKKIGILLNSAKLIVLQQLNTEKNLDQSYSKITPYTQSTLEEFSRTLSHHAEKIMIR